MKRNAVVLFAIAVIAVGIGVVYFTGLGPKKADKMEGAIGTAERHQAEQISGEDVALADPELQALLQSDLFNKYVNDPEFRKLVEAEKTDRAIADGSIGRAAVAARAVAELDKVVANARVLNKMSAALSKTSNEEDAFRQMRADAEIAKVLSAAEVDKIKNNRAAVDFLKAAELEKVRNRANQNPDFWKMVKKEGAEKLFEADARALAKFADLSKQQRAELARRKGWEEFGP